jgi:superfamily II RNA helicase
MVSVLVLCSFSMPSNGFTNLRVASRIPRILSKSTQLSDNLATPTEVQEAIDLARDELEQYFDFPLDDWQLQAGGEILMGNNVIVCSPTGSGKTVVGEMAVHIALQKSLNAIYTTPLKALSNQKFAEFRQIFGSSSVGLSTGDMSINRKDSRLTVMTTEVYRNIAWRSTGSEQGEEGKKRPKPLEVDSRYRDELEKNAVVVLDEFHYMGIPGRGGVWEECVITSPAHTQIIGLSATLPNAAQLADWMQGVTGRRTVLVEAPGKRPVPLRYLFATREGLYPLFRNPDAGPGSPLGLLGYRGDGSPVTDSPKKKKREGYGSKEDKEDDEDDELFLNENLPRGLQINPALSAAAQRRMQRVNRRLEQQKQKQRQRNDGAADEWDRYSGEGRGRGRRLEFGKMSARDERKERERLLKSEMRKAVPSLPILLTRLKEKNLLPAIFFIFSRAGCDNAAQTIANTYKGPRDPTRGDVIDEDSMEQEKKKSKSNQRGIKRRAESGNLVKDESGRTFRLDSNYVSEDVFNSVLDGSVFTGDGDEFMQDSSPLSSEKWEFYSTAGLLSADEVKIVASRIAQFNEDNYEIAFTDEVIEQYLFGVGSHHAGMLPAHKAFVEILYRANLMKAVFATETLAAGINMPARTTVICALAKRGDSSSMNLLETANLLQMSGRAGRRGMDTAGTCVIVATPFESHEEAATILTNPIKPIVSQFRPSYSLAVNLIARGEGKLDVAQQLVSNSFAMWEKRQVENMLSSASERDGVSEVLEASAQEKFMNLLVDTLQNQVDRRTAKFNVAKLQSLISVLKDRDGLKKTSKSYLGAARMLELEKTTLNFLELELKDLTSLGLDEEAEMLAALLDEDQQGLMEQIELQRQRATAATKEVRSHPFTSIVAITNEIIEEDSRQGRDLFTALRNTRDPTLGESSFTLTADDLSRFAKSSVVIKRKLRKLASANPDLDPETLLLEAEKAEYIKDDSWDDMLAITKVLVAYGCLIPENNIDQNDNALFEEQTFELTPAGVDVGMLGFDNSLWCFVAMGGTWDVSGASSKLDDFKAAMASFDDDMDFFDDDKKTLSEEPSPEEPSSEEPSPEEPSPDLTIPKPQLEAEQLVSHLRFLSPGELAGYVSCLISEGSRGSPSVIDTFQKMRPRQQRAIQISLASMERLVDVQRQYSVDEKTSNCNLDITNCEVVTAWAEGCTWSEAIEISGAAPGDLARILSRALDAVRQFGNLKFSALRKEDFEEGASVQPLARGIHPDIRTLCRDAAKEMNRYPVKDPLPFAEAVEDDIFEDDAEEEEKGEDDDFQDEEVTGEEDSELSEDQPE